jgi:uncharacterized membrane protein YfcA
VGNSYLVPALIFLFLGIVISGGFGAAIAFGSARIQRKQTVGWWKHTVLSALGFLVGSYLGFYIIYPTTFDDTVEGGAYHHPEYFGYVLAILVPVVFELWRICIVRTAKPRE